MPSSVVSLVLRMVPPQVSSFLLTDPISISRVKDAKKFLEKYKRVDLAIDMYYNDPNALAATAKQKQSEPSTSKLTSLFDKYKGALFLVQSLVFLTCGVDPDGEDITIDGTIKLCEDLSVDPEDVVLLAIAYELKSPRMGQWTKTGWIEGLKGLGYAPSFSLRFLLTRPVQLRKHTAAESPIAETSRQIVKRLCVFQESVQSYV